jgi:superfamily II DNA or RNA helicase
VIGGLVQVRSRRWLVEDVVGQEGGGHIVRLACAEDDSQGEMLDVYWDYEPDRRILEEERWGQLASKGFDDPRHFAAFLNTLRWNTVTATDPSLFQSPFRAGIKIDAYQMEPLRKALRLPRVNLFIADDTGLGKTIEAGLIARELLLRRKAKTIVVAAPPSVLEQWKAELEERFGLVFEILDRRYVTRVRRERGFGANPWRTHSRFLVSHNLLVDSNYADPMREWLGSLLPGSLLIVDEAHHAAPSSGGRYGIETKLTRAVRDLGARFEHRLFLSATPHNGHSNSFSTLLELLDPTRFTRGVKVRGREALDQVMVRRLKEDIRGIQGGFPERIVERIAIDDLPEDAPELELSRLLDEYRTAREERLSGSSARTQASAGLLVVGLQQRLLSSIEAFARSLAVHRRTVERQWAQVEPGRESALTPRTVEREAKRLVVVPGPDDDAATLPEEEHEAEEDTAIELVTEAVAAGSNEERRTEEELLDRMQAVADFARDRPDGKVRSLIEWIRTHMCPEMEPFDAPSQGDLPTWNKRRVLIFTENREGTKRYLHKVLEAAIEGTDRAEERIEVITGLTSGPARREIQRRFNTDPAEDPLRILVATDAAREGLNFQAHCADLFHFDLPWNPGRIEQRNGRIDRKLQPAAEVRCHYFVLPQRAEDHVLEVLVRKTETIKRELGSLSKVIDDEVERRLRKGIRHREAATLAAELEGLDLEEQRKRIVTEELAQDRDRQAELRQEIDRCRTLLERSRGWAGYEPAPFRATLDSSLALLGAPPLQRDADDNGREIWRLPKIDRLAIGDPSWAATLDTLRAPRPRDQKLAEWRREAPIRPILFEDAGVLTDETVHLHLDQRVAQRLLGRFRSQGFVHHDLSQACLAQVRDSIPRVILLGRLSLYGRQAERLHEELVPVAARWIEPGRREGPLHPYGRDGRVRSMELLDEALERGGGAVAEQVRSRLLESTQQDVGELLTHLEGVADAIAEAAIAKLRERGEHEAKALQATLERQRERVQGELGRHEGKLDQLTLDFNDEERRQLEANVRAWQRRLPRFEQELESEPRRMIEFYEVRARRIEPVGIAYLWPETN